MTVKLTRAGAELVRKVAKEMPEGLRHNGVTSSVHQALVRQNMIALQDHPDKPRRWVLASEGFVFCGLTPPSLLP